MKNWLNFTTHSIKQPHMSQALGKCWGQKHVISSRELFTKGSQGFQVSPESLQDRVHRLELSSPSTSSQLVYLQGARAVLRSQKWQVLCYGSIKENTGARMGSCIYPGWVSPATREEVTKAGSQSSALSHTGGLSSNPVSTLSWLTNFLLLRCQRTVSLSQLQCWANGESACFKVDCGKLVSLLLSVSRYVTDLLSHIWQAQNLSFLLFFPSR